MSDNNFRPIFVEQGGIMLNNVYWKEMFMRLQPLFPCLVFGNENRGVQDDILHDRRGHTISIEQLGVIRSYNVASASAIVLHHLSSDMKWF